MGKLKLSAPQNIFLNELNTRFRAYVGGFGSGKTFVGCLDLLLFLMAHPRTKLGYFAPTFSMIRDVFIPTLEEAAELLGFHVDFIESHKEAHIYWGRRYYGTIICRSMDNPKYIVGFKIARALVDEIDVMDPNKADQAWKKIIARLRLKVKGVENGVGVTTTPEGFQFVYKKFKKNPTKSYSMVQASTYENEEFLADGYIDSLFESYPPELIQAYLEGRFVNLSGSSIYGRFDRFLNESDKELDPTRPLLIGMDFNVNPMSAVVCQMYGTELHAVDELVLDNSDTESMAMEIKRRYPQWHEKGQIDIFPDAAGNHRQTSAKDTDHQILENHGLRVVVDGSNPRIKDRVNSMNARILNSKGERFLFVHPRCETLIECLESQIWDDKGQPDKKQGFDHSNDAIGYLVWQLFPISGEIFRQRNGR
ncbi:Phage terminase large subunit [Vibrio chagasii]|uniref:phage terminase large subunit n=1 Tax=Vibrio crassostreae TaxID=246167 RepID=UPI000633E025|nr:phage terminase large subunit [Vibrio crassostreae]CAH6805049.1 Phage terminase large subunit [Vibrio chagasii]UPR31457.1 terminase [Vibrio crassostreae]CAH6814645.1 Phage terminase large subunit [Vibrio chagasii]CAH6819840.1 Phage terminase large subunit [Vibrio chagasii]CAH6827037.1 Phage terminase large subunit [Vibrio chagasii]